MRKLGNHIKVISEKIIRNKNKRDAERSLRLTRIRESKRGIARDLAGGHNVGDFVLDLTDIPVIMRVIETGAGTSMYNLKELYEKYRGK